MAMKDSSLMAMKDSSLELIPPRSRSSASDYWANYMIGERRPTQSVDRMEGIQSIPRIRELKTVRMACEIGESQEREFPVWHEELKDRELSIWPISKVISKEIGFEYPPPTEHQPPRMFTRKEAEHIGEATERIARAVEYITQNLAEKKGIENSSEIRKKVWEALGKE